MSIDTWESRVQTRIKEPVTRHERQSNILFDVEELYKSQGGPLYIARQVTVPTIGGRIKMGNIEGEVIDAPATLVFMATPDEKRHIFMVLAHDGKKFGPPMTSRSDFGCKRGEEWEGADGFAVEIDYEDPEACVMYRIDDGRTVQMPNLQLMSFRNTTPDPEMFAGTCIRGCRKSLEHEAEENKATQEQADPGLLSQIS